MFERDNGVCAICGAVGVEWDVDHIIPLVEGGTHTLDNARTLCREKCHKAQTRLLRQRLNGRIVDPIT